MNEPNPIERITFNPDTLGGKPCIRDTRIPVDLVIRWLADGWSMQQITDEYPLLDEADIRAALAYAYAVLADEHLDAVRLGA